MTTTVAISTENYINIQKAGSKVHTGRAGSSKAVCGWWTKWHLSKLFTNKETTCEKCLEHETRYIDKDEIVKLPDDGFYRITVTYLEVK